MRKCPDASAGGRPEEGLIRQRRGLACPWRVMRVLVKLRMQKATMEINTE